MDDFSILHLQRIRRPIATGFASVAFVAGSVIASHHHGDPDILDARPEADWLNRDGRVAIVAATSVTSFARPYWLPDLGQTR